MVYAPGMKNDSQHTEIDLHRIELRYIHTRIQKESVLNELRNSIEQYGLLMPVQVVPDTKGGFVLIDGYLRVAAVKKCGWDTVDACICEIDEKNALISVLRRGSERRQQAIEQASIIRELIDRFDMSMSQVARKMARDKSWVKRRLDIVDHLPEESLNAVRTGHVSPWAASRVLAPLARANNEHARRLTRYLIDQPLPTRQLADFYEHYKKSNRKVRERMIADPGLFFKAQKSKKKKQEAEKVKVGPEGLWIKDMQTVSNILSRLFSNMETVFYRGQAASDRNELIRAFGKAKNQIELIDKEIMCHD